MNVVAYDGSNNIELEKKLFLGDAISDLPPVCRIYISTSHYFVVSFYNFFFFFFHFTTYIVQVDNDEQCDIMPYGSEPKTEFQHFIRLRKDGELIVSSKK